MTLELEGARPSKPIPFEAKFICLTFHDNDEEGDPPLRSYSIFKSTQEIRAHYLKHGYEIPWMNKNSIAVIHRRGHGVFCCFHIYFRVQMDDIIMAPRKAAIGGGD